MENKICGATDIELTAKGHNQAVETGKKILEARIRADEILTSPLIRASETARHISEITGIPVRVEPKLIEQNFGRYESTPRNGQEFHEAKKHMASRYGTGESMLQLAQRIYNLLDDVKASDKVYILVAHNGIARIVESYFREMDNEEFSAFGIRNCEIRRYDFAHPCISFPEQEYESIQKFLNKLGYCYTTRVYKEVGKYKVGEFYTAPWGDVLRIDEVKTYWKVSERPFYDEMNDDERAEIRKYSEDMGLPYEFIKFSKSTQSE